MDGTAGGGGGALDKLLPKSIVAKRRRKKQEAREEDAAAATAALLIGVKGEDVTAPADDVVSKDDVSYLSSRRDSGSFVHDTDIVPDRNSSLYSYSRGYEYGEDHDTTEQFPSIPNDDSFETATMTSLDEGDLDR
ncbi:GRAM domain-containing protein [Colletotrichum sojae]|uniref:GRAM domain-containing protein n=1 Tax=Colletotrichum sojae TaxID=2175907 RepID=A0A8H6JPV2_9PEZI|nr:GRAM domain-containing protein [Colletotrichum sojae]